MDRMPRMRTATTESQEQKYQALVENLQESINALVADPDMAIPSHDPEFARLLDEMFLAERFRTGGTSIAEQSDKYRNRNKKPGTKK